VLVRVEWGMGVGGGGWGRDGGCGVGVGLEGYEWRVYGFVVMWYRMLSFFSLFL
jgi:hypothetical protein